MTSLNNVSFFVNKYQLNQPEIDQLVQKVGYFNKKILPNQVYRRLYYHPSFKEIKDDLEIGKYPNIGLDKFMIISSDKGSLATNGLATCFAVCFRGKTSKGIIFIGLCHTTHLMPLKDLFAIFRNKMIKKGCLKETIEFFVLGGQIVCDDPDIDSLNMMEDTLDLVEKYNIKGIRFNHSIDYNDDLKVLFTSDKIYYSVKDFFSDLPGYEDAGEDLF